MFKRILDSSNVNPATLTEVKESGAVALIWKATQGTGFVDKTLPQGKQIASTLGIPFGSYVFQDPRTPGASQAAFYLKVAKPKVGDIEPIIDSEMKGVSFGQVAANVEQIAAALEVKGFRPLLYGSTSWLTSLYAADPKLRRLRVWQAEYPRFIPRLVKQMFGSRTRLGKGVTVVAWQYTDGWKVGGHGFDGSYLLAPLDSILIKKGL